MSAENLNQIKNAIATDYVIAWKKEGSEYAQSDVRVRLLSHGAALFEADSKHIDDKSHKALAYAKSLFIHHLGLVKSLGVLPAVDPANRGMLFAILIEYILEALK